MAFGPSGAFLLIESSIIPLVLTLLLKVRAMAFIIRRSPARPLAVAGRLRLCSVGIGQCLGFPDMNVAIALLRMTCLFEVGLACIISLSGMLLENLSVKVTRSLVDVVVVPVRVRPNRFTVGAVRHRLVNIYYNFDFISSIVTRLVTSFS